MRICSLVAWRCYCSLSLLVSPGCEWWANFRSPQWGWCELIWNSGQQRPASEPGNCLWKYFQPHLLWKPNVSLSCILPPLNFASNSVLPISVESWIIKKHLNYHMDFFVKVRVLVAALNLSVYEDKRFVTLFKKIFFFLFCFLGPHLQHREVPRLGVKSEL